jgi:hypothetical protein
MTPFISASAPAPAPVNRASNLSAENFPSLGGAAATSAHRYEAAEALARKSKQVKPPSLTSASDFPSPPAPSSSTLVRDKILDDRKPVAAAKAAPSLDTVNFPPPPSASNGQVTVAQMKAVLGPKYKELKSLTKEFASGSLAPEAYVDHAARLFDGGYSDADFWSFVPNLLIGCPNAAASNQAIRYMDELRTSASNAQVAAASTSSSWSAAPASVAAAPKRAPTTTTVASSSWAASTRPAAQSFASASRIAPVTSSKTAPSAWGSGSSAAMARSKPGTVSLAASKQGPQQGTATKFMAKEQKKDKQHQQQQQSHKKDKKKELDELRALAFGR